jgi:hypothetical protein
MFRSSCPPLPLIFQDVHTVSYDMTWHVTVFISIGRLWSTLLLIPPNDTMIVFSRYTLIHRYGWSDNSPALPSSSWPTWRLEINRIFFWNFIRWVENRFEMCWQRWQSSRTTRQIFHQRWNEKKRNKWTSEVDSPFWRQCRVYYWQEVSD